ncbi:retropepsin-like aspartic protease family protein [Gilvimarinus polysaccharolyticus]|uniref:retropepsin-like aspartic protease family protein n=1 Tax=Gilvimarinus polysaccharolyticus TaxID=863921 RepID=UPI0006737600|nr:TIGR02281 family clan AA aspartic protease [Gilvimarinus polysaccharolyticus]
MWLLRLVIIATAWMLSGTVAAADLSAKMLAKDTALISLDGKQRMLRAGQTSPEGVTLISSSRTGAEVEYDGVQYSLTLSSRIATSFVQAESIEVRLNQSSGGHYRSSGMINGQSVKFLVDTGATSVAMGVGHAERLGLDYKNGDQGVVTTANGQTHAYAVWLRSVAVGGITLSNVQAVVIANFGSQDILLGNSFLSNVDMSTDNGVLVLRVAQ